MIEVEARPSETIAEDALALADLIRGHRNDAGCCCWNTLLSEVGHASPIGRCLLDGRFVNPAVAVNLDDLAHDLGKPRAQPSIPEELRRPGHARIEPPATPAAELMVQHARRRDRSMRCRPLPAEARHAVQSYLREREELFSAARVLFVRAKAPPYTVKEADWLLRRLARLRRLLAETWSDAR
jgi:hypothetical protein